MKEKIIRLLKLLIALAKADPGEQELIARLTKENENLKAEIATFHGDETLNDPEVLALLTEAEGVFARVQPDDEDLDNDPSILPVEDELLPDPDEDDQPTVEELVKDNSADALKQLAADNEVDISGLTTKTEIAEAIVAAREE